MAGKRKRSIDHLKGDWTVAELSVIYKPTTLKSPQITSTEGAHQLIRSLWNEETISLQEQFMALFFNRANRLIGFRVISTGTMDACVVDVKLLGSLALHCLCEQVIIAHNHPSGNLKPSVQDEVIPIKVKEALALIDVKLMDHFILTQGYSEFDPFCPFIIVFLLQSFTYFFLNLLQV